VDLDNLLRTYMHLNDPKYAGITYKFAGAFVVLALAFGISAWAGAVRDDGANDFHAATGPQPAPDDGTPATQGLLRVYVGYDPATFSLAKGYDRDKVDGALRDWLAAHPDASLVGPPQPVLKDGLLIGHWITYR